MIELAGREMNAEPLTEQLRVVAQGLIQQAVEMELQALLAEHVTRRIEAGHTGVVRNGYQPECELQTGTGPVTAKIPKLRVKAPVTFRSDLVPSYVRKTKSLKAVLPWLYLKSLSSGESVPH